jgi:tRNA(Ile)-lysidine synthase
VDTLCLLSIYANIVLKGIKNDILSHQLFDEADQIGLAISGGKDSVAVAHLLNECGVSFCMVHVNFGLRGAESDGDETFLHQLAQDLKYCTSLLTKKVDTKKYVSEHKISTQEAARELRYSYFEELYQTHCFTKLITAHHAADQVETFFINVYRKSGINGLRGIPPSRDYIIRPFLSVTQSEIISYINEHNITYREDSSNGNSQYLRNKFRNKILPAIAQELPDFENRTLGSISILQKESELFKVLIDKEIKQIVNHTDAGITIQKKGVLSFPHGSVILYNIIDKYLFNFSQCEQIIASIQGESGKSFYSETHQIAIDRDLIYLVPLKSKLQDGIEIHGEGTYSLCSTSITLKRVQEVVFEKSANVEYVELHPSCFPLQWRFWQQGDRISPLGMQGSKLVSDVFIDLKIPNPSKSSIPLLCSEKDVLWIAGYRLSDKVKVKSYNHLYQIYLTFDTNHAI